jgi:hypothetical protein
LQIKTKIVSCHTPDSKPVKQEVNGTVILPPLVFPGLALANSLAHYGMAIISGVKSFVVQAPGIELVRMLK